MPKKQLPEKKKGGKSRQSKKSDSSIEKSHEQMPDKYWDEVAEDAASGYTTKEDGSPLLNIDQQPGDNERGDGSLPSADDSPKL